MCIGFQSTQFTYITTWTSLSVCLSFSLFLLLSLSLSLSLSHTHTHKHTYIHPFILLKQLQVVSLSVKRASEVCLFYNYSSHCVHPTAVPQTTISASATLYNGCQITPCGLCWERPLYLKHCRNFWNNRDTQFLCSNFLSSSVFDTILLVILSFVCGDTCSFSSLFISFFSPSPSLFISPPTNLYASHAFTLHCPCWLRVSPLWRTLPVSSGCGNSVLISPAYTHWAG